MSEGIGDIPQAVVFSAVGRHFHEGETVPVPLCLGERNLIRRDRERRGARYPAFDLDVIDASGTIG